ncbi:MAG: hypothetical protein ACRCYU_02660 [Nocardioides sp.]
MSDVLVDMVRVIDVGERDEAWTAYIAAFVELRAVTVQRQELTREQFEVVAASPGAVKVIARDAGTGVVVGMASATNQLARPELTAPNILNPEYFEARWPNLVTQNRAWYVPLVAVVPEARGGPAFGAIVGALTREIAAGGGVYVADVSLVNVARRMPQAVRDAIGRVVPEVTLSMVDAQTYWCCGTPGQLPDQLPDQKVVIDITNTSKLIDVDQPQTRSVGPHQP